MRPGMIEMRNPLVQNQPEMALVEGNEESRRSRRNVQPKRSQKEFAFGALTGVRNTRTPMSVTCLSSSFEKMLSQS